VKLETSGGTGGASGAPTTKPAHIRVADVPPRRLFVVRILASRYDGAGVPRADDEGVVAATRHHDGDGIVRVRVRCRHAEGGLTMKPLLRRQWMAAALH